MCLSYHVIKLQIIIHRGTLMLFDVHEYITRFVDTFILK